LETPGQTAAVAGEAATSTRAPPERGDSDQQQVNKPEHGTTATTAAAEVQERGVGQGVHCREDSPREATTCADHNSSRGQGGGEGVGHNRSPEQNGDAAAVEIRTDNGTGVGGSGGDGSIGGDDDAEPCCPPADSVDCNQFVANAAVHGDHFSWHVDADPWTLPHSTWTQRYGHYFNRVRHRPCRVDVCGRT
jgi:hypothetical protein